MPTTIAYQATILGGIPVTEEWLNDTGADVEVGTVIKRGSIFGIVTGGNSQDGSTKVLSTVKGSATFTPGLLTLLPAFTTDSYATGTLIYWDTSNARLSSSAITSGAGGKIGYTATSKAAGVATCTIKFNQTQVV